MSTEARIATNAVLVALLCGALLTGCIGGAKRDAPRVFAPAATETATADTARVDAALAVRLPTAGQMLDSNRIVARTGVEELQYLAGVAWSDPAPRLVQDVLLQTFEACRCWHAVGRGGRRPSRYSLDLELRRFDAEYLDAGVPTAVVALRVSLADTRAEIASRDIEARVVADARDATAAAAALGVALRQAAQELTQWTTAQAAEHARTADDAAAATTDSGRPLADSRSPDETSD